jgi:hypothetical protein
MTTPVAPPSIRQGEPRQRIETFGIQRRSALLGQAAPAATTDTTAYTVPKGRYAEVRVYVAERGNAAATFRVALRKAGAAIANAHYVAFDYALVANGRDSLGPFDLTADDVVTVRASTANVSFNVTGWEEPQAP